MFSSALLCLVLAINSAAVLSAPVSEASPPSIHPSGPELHAYIPYASQIPPTNTKQPSTPSNLLQRHDGPTEEESSSSSETHADSGWDFSIPGGPSASWDAHYEHEHEQEHEQESETEPETITTTIVVPPPSPTTITSTAVVTPSSSSPAPTPSQHTPVDECEAPTVTEIEPGVVVVCECEEE